MRIRASTARFNGVLLLPLIWVLGSCAALGKSGDERPARPASPASAAPLVTELLADLDAVETKIIALAERLSQEQYSWRPNAEGVRSSGEVLMHVAAINYFFPTAAGFEPPPSTGTLADDAATAGAYEGSLASKEPVLAELRSSFQHQRAGIESTRTLDLDHPVEVFGRSRTLGRCGSATPATCTSTSAS